MDFLRTTGIFGLAIAAVGGALFVAWIVAICCKATRKSVLLVAALALLPLLIGLCGAGIGHAAVRASAEAAGIGPEDSVELLASGFRQANMVAYMGLAVTVVLWGLCAISLPFARRDRAAA